MIPAPALAWLKWRGSAHTSRRKIHMPVLMIADVEQMVFVRLRERASAHGRTPEAEANAILHEALQRSAAAGWASVNAVHDHLAASGRSFTDSAPMLREDRDR